MRFSPAGYFAQTAQPRFSATFGGHELPPVPENYTDTEVHAALEKIATDPTLKAYVLDKPGTEDVEISIKEHSGDWGQKDRRYGLSFRYELLGKRQDWVPWVMNINGLKNTEDIVYQILSAFREILEAQGLQLQQADKVVSAPIQKSDDGQNNAPRGFAALAGMDKLRDKLQQEVVAAFKNPEAFRKYGLTVPNGMLLYGPQGCGKTYVAEKLAEELGYPLIEVSMGAAGSEFIHKSVTNIRQIFEDAAKQAPAILFLDELDAMAPHRDGLSVGHHKEEEIAELLTQLRNAAKRGILVVAATNKPWKLDSAILRSERLDKHIYIGPPNKVAREALLKFHMQGRCAEPEISLDFTTMMSENFAASDLKMWVDEAARLAMAEDRPIQSDDFLATAPKIRSSISPKQLERFKRFRPRG